MKQILLVIIKKNILPRILLLNIMKIIKQLATLPLSTSNADEDHEIDFAQAYAIMTHSQTKLAQQQEEAKKKLDAPQMPVTIAKRGTALPSLPNDSAKNQVLIILLHLVFQSPVCLMLIPKLKISTLL